MIRTRMITAGYQLRFQRLLLALRDAVQITQKMTVCSGSLLRHRFFGDNYVQQSGGRSFYSKTALNSIHTFCSFSVVKPKKTGITTLFFFSCVNFDFINWERTPNTLWLLLHNSVYIFPSQHPPTMYWGKIVKSQNPSDKEMGDSQGINKGQTCCYILKQQKDSKGKFLKLGNIGTRLWMGHFTTLRHSALLMVHTCGLHRIPQQTSVLEECLSAGNEARCKQSLRPNAVLYERAGKSWAAVLVSLCTVMGQPALLFTLRSSMLKGRHKGDISFAGGKKDPSDKTVIDTALREAHEELGIHIAEDQVWGVLKPLHDMSGMTIAPVIANLGQLETLSFQPNPSEVEEIFTLTLHHLCQPQNRGYTHFRTGDHYSYTLPVFHSQKYRVWGLTAVALDHALRLIVPQKQLE